jgi:hypothetical protein
MDIHELINRCDVIAVQAMQLKEALLKGNLDDKPSANSLAINRQAKGLCVYCAEPIKEDEQQFRGAHQRCYKKVNRMLNAGIITDETAIEKGWLLPRERGGRPLGAKDPIARYLAELSGNLAEPEGGK